MMIGKVIGSYRIERELSEGGMSHVYVGTSVEKTTLLPKDFTVVLKIMSDELATEETARKRFIKEAQILSRLRHRNITRFYEFIPRDEGSVLVMEFVEGDPVDRIISRDGPLPIPEAVRIASSLLDALVYAHAKGIVHRDIKPANLIREPAGEVKVTDFGIAKIKEGTGGSTVLTRSGLLLGTPHYMSPEQIREPQEAGANVDIYSTGVLLYEMLTGTLPFQATSLRKLIDAIYRGEKKPPSQVRKGIDLDLDAIVVKAMNPDAAQRYESALDFVEALANYATTPQHAMPDAEPTVRNVNLKFRLKPVQGDGGGHDLAGEVLLGRDTSCAIVIAHPAVSRRHAKLSVRGPLLHVEDLNSANGTWVNNGRVTEADLKPGDVIRFGADPACTFLVTGE
jgi:eukaryotic-like serine/threonine-protein kinase